MNSSSKDLRKKAAAKPGASGWNSFGPGTASGPGKQPGRVKKSTKQPVRSPLSKQERFEVLQRDHFRCCLCGVSAEEGARLQVDHRVPVSKGGTNDPHNLQTLCEACNQGKRDRLI